MKISFSWLKQYIDTDLTPDAVADKLTLLGLEVEGIETVGSTFDHFVVGEVLDVKSHPSADKLVLCSVDIGGRQVQIVCGAHNVADGQKVPVATVGAVVAMPDGKTLKIKKVKLRGEVSEGMICSESELGISDDHSGIMVLDDGPVAGTPLTDALGLHGDDVFEIALTPNRPDASSHIGVARDLAAVLKQTIRNPYAFEPAPAGPVDEWIDVKIDDTGQCHRYVAKIVTDLKVGDSPAWLKNRLTSIGLRPVNNVVDATNYVLHEIGQPLHAFDYNLLKSKRIHVESFERDVDFQTLDGVKRKVPAGTLFICDGEKPVALAGIMGGLESEVQGKTTTVLIESAWFDPASIRRTSKKTGIQTDSSYRFERGVDPDLARRACEKAADLIAELAGGKVISGCTDVHPVRKEPTRVSLRPERVNRLLGTTLKRESMQEILHSLEIVTKERDDTLDCTIPTFRPDLTREVDLIEEVGRIFDYNNIPKPETSPFYSPAPLNRWEILHNRVRTIATRLNYKEIATNSLLSNKEESLFSESKEQVVTLNPVSQEATTLRTTLLAGFMKTLQHNLNRNANQLRFFESGHTYRRSSNGTWIKGIEEHSKLLLGICGYRSRENWRHSPELFSVFDLKSDLLAFLGQLGAADQLEYRSTAPERLDFYLDEEVAASLFRVPDTITRAFDVELPVFAAEIDLTRLYEAGQTEANDLYVKIPKFPSFEYDVAYTVDRSVPAGNLSRIIRDRAGEQLQNLEVFDVYEGKNLGDNKKSIAFRLTFLDRNKTLNINDVEPVVKKITKVLESEFSAQLRS